MTPNFKSWHITFLLSARAFTVGLAYYAIADIPGLTSSMVAIFVALLPFDLIVAMPKFSAKLDSWKELVSIILPRITGTAIALGVGLLIGGVFGALTWLGFPLFLGAIFTVGLAYSVGTETKGNVSSFVGIIGGLSLFEQIIHLQAGADTMVVAIMSTALRMVYGTFAALFAGWVAGIVMGVVTRLFLPRGFRTSKSAAYAQPLWMQSFKEVTHIDSEDMVVIRIKVGEGSPLANKTLAETGLRTQYGASVLSIFRQPKDVVAPTGSELILPGDLLVVMTPEESTNTLLQLAKGSD